MKRLRSLWPLGIILTVWLLFSFPYWGKGNAPFPGTYLVTFFAPWSTTHGMPVKNNAMPDVITQIYPWKRVTINGWKTGELPLWNPYSFSGTSHIGTYQSAIFSPVNALFLVLPEMHAWSLMILLQPILAGIGMYLFLRALQRSGTGSVIGALSFMFCGFLVVWMAYGTLGYAVLALPYVLLGLHRLMEKGSIPGGVLATVAIAFSFVSGHFQMSLYVLLFAAGYVLFHAFSSRKRTHPLWALMFIGLGVAIAAPQLIAGIDAYTKAVRSSIFAKGEVIPWPYIVTMFSPDFFGNPVTRNDWFGHYAEWAGFVGVVPLALSIVSVMNVRKELLIRFFAIVAVLPFMFEYQTPFVDWLFMLKVPVLSTSSASRIIVLTSFSLAVLAAFGFDRLTALWETRAVRKVIRWISLLAVIVVSVWLTLLVIRPMEGDKLAIAVRNSVLPTIFLVTAMGAGFIGTFLPKRVQVILPVLFVLITAFDAYRFSAKWMPFDPMRFVYPATPVITKLRELTADDQSRVVGNLGNEVGSGFGLQLLEGYDAVYQHRYGRFISSVTTGTPHQVDRSVVTYDKHGKYSEKIIQLLGARYYAHKKMDGRFPWAYPYWEFPHYRFVWADDQYEIWENTKSLPRAFAASSYVVAASEQQALDVLYAPRFDQADVLVLEREPDIRPATGSATVSISDYGTSKVVLDVISETPKLVFLSDVYDEGWQAWVNGNRVPVLRADVAFRAVGVPKGKSTIVMKYRPLSVTYGLTVTGFATLCLVGVLIWKKRV